MRSVWTLVFTCAGTLLAGSSASAQTAPKLDDVLKSISESSRGDQEAINFVPFALVVVAAILVYVAVKHWNHRQSVPKVLNNHAKLIKEAASVTGVSARSLKNLESLAKAQGMSSPLVAMLCPSAITDLARNVKTESERKAVSELASQLLKA